MSRDLESVFEELGISQYLETFVDQGFDTWETILDITESDLDVLGVKLGHRRKLQRRIANSRGLAPEASLVSPTRANGEEPKPEVVKPEQPRLDAKDVAIVTKRKYRRHPKNDENAPERPPSAYVLFSNKMRDDLKGRNLTFTEIAKLVGENWQSLSPGEKEPFERQAQNAKEKYNRDLGEYKKTPEYKRYSLYLHEFKQKQASQNHAKDASKRLKLDAGPRMNHGSSASLTPRSGSVTGSGSDSHEGPLPRKHRVGSTTSVPDSRFSPIPLTHQMSIDEPMHSPTSTQFDERSPAMQHASPPRRRPTWGESRSSAEPGSQHLPSLSDVFSDRMTGVTRTSDGPNGFPGFMPGQSMHGQPQPPPLKHEQSTGSMGSSSSGVSYPRTPSDASLPIHALLSNKAGPLVSGYGSPPPPYYGHGAPAPNEQRLPFPPMSSGPSPHGMANGHFSPPPLMKYASTGSSGATEVSIPSTRTSLSVHDSAVGNGKSESTMDGMNALLRAGEIVGRRN
ncbi:hypothetical protein F5X68DRAFT_64788 [Plectosphaerella plurivora]|uniref:HMG box domain-containing protein n=1 Tax=Plectosphaerella plurivora TaxID=936078 RepID=A0A9P8VGH8_9PEZI|nr:hypothetical protein F5X68DRAFT_64788 [Plectosphaerella plurivora]